MKKLIIGLLLLMLAGSASALNEVRYWEPGGTHAPPLYGELDEWADPNNWNTSSPVWGLPGDPNSTDWLAILHVLTPMPVIDSAVQSCNWIGVAWHNSADSSLLVKSGGSISANQLWVTHNDNDLDAGNGIVTIQGGTIDIAGITQMTNVSPLAKAQIDIDSGWLETATLAFGPGRCNIDIEPGALLYLDGEQIYNVTSWVANGLITADDGLGTVTFDYDYSRMGYTTLQGVASTYTPDILWTADFEDGEVNPGYLPASTYPGTSINTEALPGVQPSPFSASIHYDDVNDRDGYGWTNRAAGHFGGGTIVVDTVSQKNSNSASVENRTLRTDIPLDINEGLYIFTFWYMVPSGQES